MEAIVLAAHSSGRDLPRQLRRDPGSKRTRAADLESRALKGGDHAVKVGT